MTEALRTAGNADPAEIARYNALAEQWWQQDGPLWPLHKLNELRSPYVIRRACRHFRRDATGAQPLAGLTVLDIGCGAGLLSEALARAGATVTGIDAAERNIAIARAHARDSGLDIDYQHAAAEDFNASAFDIVLNMEVVEHVVDLPRFMRRAAALVAPGGMMFVATLNRTLSSFVAAIVGAEYVLRWLPRGTHQWRKFVTPSECSAFLASSGLAVADRVGVRINPLTRHYSLGRSLSVNYMITAVRP